MTSNHIEYELINGKPHLGLWLGKFLYCQYIQKESDEDPYYAECKSLLLNWAKHNYSDFEIRHIKFIYRPPFYVNPLNNGSTLAIKFLLWGRAFKVLKHKRNPNPTCRYTKKRVSGRIKWVRIK